MSEYNNEMKGVLFVNQEKSKEKSPDYSGHCTIKGKKWKLAGWKAVSKNGKTYLDIRISDPNDYKNNNDMPF